MVLSRGQQLRIRQPTTRLLSEFLSRTFPSGGYTTQVPLGPVPQAAIDGFGEIKGALMARPFRPKVDAIAFPSSQLVLIEAKEPMGIKGAGDLLYYAALVPTTPELASFSGRQLVKWLLVPFVTPALEAAAPVLGIEIHVYAPEWYQDRIRDLQNYWTKEYQDNRLEVRRLREAMGLG